ncbi:MAG: hypothetical protein ABIX01_13870 [Chitinophagaceae bacterium]
MRFLIFSLILSVFITRAQAEDCDIGTTGVTAVNATNTAPSSSGYVGQVFNFKFSIANFGTNLGCIIPANSVNAVFDFPTLSGGIKPYVYNGPVSFSSGYFTWTYNAMAGILEGTNTTAIPNNSGDLDILVQVIGNQTSVGGVSVGTSSLNLTQSGATSDNTGNNFGSAQLTISAISLNLKVLLQGALLGNAPLNASTMRDNLRNSPFTGSNYIPSSDPYSNNAAYNGSFTRVGDGTNPALQTVTTPGTMFNNRLNAAVDWIFLELRSKNNPATVVATRSAIVQRDGSVVDIDGGSCIRFPTLKIDSFYVAVRHRNHLGAMTALPVPAATFNCSSTVDFTTMTAAQLWNNTVAYDGFEMATLSDGKRALWAGNANSDKKIKYTAPGDDLFQIFTNTLLHPANTGSDYNFDFGYGYIAGDVDMNSKVKYTAPNDDSFQVFVQLLLYGLNTGADYNYDFFLEQLP